MPRIKLPAPVDHCHHKLTLNAWSGWYANHQLSNRIGRKVTAFYLTYSEWCEWIIFTIDLKPWLRLQKKKNLNFWKNQNPFWYPLLCPDHQLINWLTGQQINFGTKPLRGAFAPKGLQCVRSLQGFLLNAHQPLLFYEWSHHGLYNWLCKHTHSYRRNEC